MLLQLLHVLHLLLIMHLLLLNLLLIGRSVRRQRLERAWHLLWVDELAGHILAWKRCNEQ